MVTRASEIRQYDADRYRALAKSHLASLASIGHAIRHPVNAFRELVDSAPMAEVNPLVWLGAIALPADVVVGVVSHTIGAAYCSAMAGVYATDIRTPA